MSFTVISKKSGKLEQKIQKLEILNSSNPTEGSQKELQKHQVQLNKIINKQKKKQIPNP